MPTIHDDVVNVLSRLGVASLTTYVGEEKVNRFNGRNEYLKITQDCIDQYPNYFKFCSNLDDLSFSIEDKNGDHHTCVL